MKLNNKNYQLSKNMVQSSKYPNSLPLNVKLDYCLGWLDMEIPE